MLVELFLDACPRVVAASDHWWVRLFALAGLLLRDVDGHLLAFGNVSPLSARLSLNPARKHPLHLMTGFLILLREFSIMAAVTHFADKIVHAKSHVADLATHQRLRLADGNSLQF